MIIQNLVVGTDKFGHKIQCGDICSFKINLQRPNLEEQVEELKGMIVYDEDTYSFAFETMDNHAPFLLMQCAELNSIEKLFEANECNFTNIPDGEKWREIFEKNLRL